MLDGKPDCELFYLARIAAVIHALCLRDEVSVPDWVFDAKLPEPEIIVNRIKPDSNYGKIVMSRAPAVSKYHNLYYHPEMLDKATGKQRFDPFLEDGRHWLDAEYV